MKNIIIFVLLMFLLVGCKEIQVTGKVDSREYREAYRTYNTCGISFRGKYECGVPLIDQYTEHPEQFILWIRTPTCKNLISIDVTKEQFISWEIGQTITTTIMDYGCEGYNEKVH